MSTFVIGILDFLITVVQETDWASFVQGIVDCIEAVDWIGLAGKIYTLLYSALGVAFGALAKFIGTLIADGFAAAKDYFNGKIEAVSYTHLDVYKRQVVTVDERLYGSESVQHYELSCR